ncbi:polysaccharide deacetylase family protein [Candidatus Daviesbacteria bacterium]|nr:polysaccharide deacetylase family protein [Candidatus Daviesbacteria bacterium]
MSNYLILLLLSLLTLAVSVYYAQNFQIPTITKIAQESKIEKVEEIKQQIPVHSGRQFRVPILLYHYIGNNPNPEDQARDNLSVTPDKFDEQMGYLQTSGFTPITLDTLAAGLFGKAELPTKPIVITFDDGYIDLYYNAFPILKKYQFRAVAFVPTGLVGTTYYASWEQLDEMQRSGLLAIESHSITHQDLTALSKDQRIKELSESKKILETRYGGPVNFIAYPYGFSNQQVWQDARSLGYVGGLGTWYSNIVSEGVIYNMPRIKIPGSDDINTFASRL